MMFLIKVRSLLICSLIILGCSFVYIGFTGINTDYGMAVEKDLIDEVNETKQVMAENSVDRDIKHEDKEKEKVSPIKMTAVNDDFFADFRIKRDKGQANQVEILKEIVDNPNSTSEMRTEAQKKLLAVSNNSALETKVENLLRAKDYNDSVAVIEKDNITIIVKASKLNQPDVKKLADLVIKATGSSLDKISIIPKK